MKLGKADLRGRRCHCPPGLALHLVHSEALREACDVVLTERGNVVPKERPEVPVRSLVHVGREVTAGDAIWVKTDQVDAFFEHVFPAIEKPFVLVTGDSDLSRVARHRRALESPLLGRWFAQNCDLDHPKVTPTPIGVDNPVMTKLEKRAGYVLAALLGRMPFDPTFSKNDMGDQARLHEVARAVRPTPREKPLRVLGTFHRATRLLPRLEPIPDRLEAFERFRRDPLCTFPERRLTQLDWWRAHDDFAFELSPRGNGLDCFRTWECLFLGTIPIVKTSSLDRLYRDEDVPVAIVRSWDEVTRPNLERWRDELAPRFDDALRARLSADHWIAKIRAAQTLARG